MYSYVRARASHLPLSLPPSMEVWTAVAFHTYYSDRASVHDNSAVELPSLPMMLCVYYLQDDLTMASASRTPF